MIDQATQTTTMDISNTEAVVNEEISHVFAPYMDLLEQSIDEQMMYLQTLDQKTLITAALVAIFLFIFILTFTGKKTKQVDEFKKTKQLFFRLKMQKKDFEYNIQKYLSLKSRILIARRLLLIFFLYAFFEVWRSQEHHQKSPITKIVTLNMPFSYYVPIMTMIFVMVQMTIKFVERKIRIKQFQQTNVISELKLTEQHLIDQIDPEVLKRLKQIVKKELKPELKKQEELIMQEKCTSKCKLNKEMLKKDMERSNKLADIMTKFNWCDDCCSEQQQMAQKYRPCKHGCVLRLKQMCEKHMAKFEKEQQTIQMSQQAIRDLTIKEKIALNNKMKEYRQDDEQ